MFPILIDRIAVLAFKMIHTSFHNHGLLYSNLSLLIDYNPVLNAKLEIAPVSLVSLLAFLTRQYQEL